MRRERESFADTCREIQLETTGRILLDSLFYIHIELRRSEIAFFLSNVYWEEIEFMIFEVIFRTFFCIEFLACGKLDSRLHREVKLIISIITRPKLLSSCHYDEHTMAMRLMTKISRSQCVFWMSEHLLLFIYRVEYTPRNLFITHADFHIKNSFACTLTLSMYCMDIYIHIFKYTYRYTRESPTIMTNPLIHILYVFPFVRVTPLTVQFWNLTRENRLII